MNYFYFTLCIGKKFWKSQTYYNDSSDFARLRDRFIDAVEWIRSFVSELNTSQFLVVVALLNRLSSLSRFDTRETVFFANDFLTINQEA